MSDYTPSLFEVRELVEHNTWLTADEFDRMIEAVRSEEREKADRGCGHPNHGAEDHDCAPFLPDREPSERSRRR